MKYRVNKAFKSAKWKEYREGQILDYNQYNNLTQHEKNYCDALKQGYGFKDEEDEDMIAAPSIEGLVGVDYSKIKVTSSEGHYTYTWDAIPNQKYEFNETTSKGGNE